MAKRDPKPGVQGATPPPPSHEMYGGKKLDLTPPADHDNFVEAREQGLAAIRARLAERRKRH
jgi:hypothetical protein